MKRSLIRHFAVAASLVLSLSPLAGLRAQGLPADQDDAYILGPGDSLALRFLAATELSGPFNLLSDGTASLPLLGNVRLTGLTLPKLASGWKPFINVNCCGLSSSSLWLHPGPCVSP